MSRSIKRVVVSTVSGEDWVHRAYESPYVMEGVLRIDSLPAVRYPLTSVVRWTEENE
jgi:hypothetical protein